MEQHSKSSLIVAKFLESHQFVEKVLHPGLPSHPQHELALRQTYGHSGIMSFYIKGGLNESKKFLQSIKVFTLVGYIVKYLLKLQCAMALNIFFLHFQAESLGGYESLAELP